MQARETHRGRAGKPREMRAKPRRESLTLVLLRGRLWTARFSALLPPIAYWLGSFCVEIATEKLMVIIEWVPVQNLVPRQLFKKMKALLVSYLVHIFGSINYF